MRSPPLEEGDKRGYSIENCLIFQKSPLTPLCQRGVIHSLPTNLSHTQIGFIVLGMILAVPAPLSADNSSFSNADKNRNREPSPYHAREVRNTITKRQNMLQTCYLNFLKTKPKKTDGTSHLDWMIQSKGDVKNVEVISSELDNKPFLQCLTRAIATWKFPPPPTEKPTYVDHEFRFKKTE